MRLLIAGQLRAVRVPTPEEEALRDLVRAREDLRGDLMRARHRVGMLLLRHDRRFAVTRNWTQAHREWLRRVELDEPVAQAVLEDGVGAIDALVMRRDALERQMQDALARVAVGAGGSPAGLVARLDTLSALGLCAEVGDFRRFQRPTELMGFFGVS